MTGIGIAQGVPSTLTFDDGTTWAPMPGELDLICDECGAGWVGPSGESCWWCERAEERQRRWQAEMVLTPPDVDPDDIARDGVLEAWGDRIALAVTAGLITAEQADRVWRREVAA